MKKSRDQLIEEIPDNEEWCLLCDTQQPEHEDNINWYCVNCGVQLTTIIKNIDDCFKKEG